jgi:GNAT superfamily N-acetyltransferase
VTAHEYLIRRTTPDDWRQVRELRLEMIRDTPAAYVETLEQAEAHDEAEWRLRGARGHAEHGISIVAVAPSGRWVATMGGFVPDAASGPLLVGVYVAPDVRGREVGLADAMLTTIEDWARTEGDRLTLHVHEDNARARAFYLRRGFVATGRTLPYPLAPEQSEVEMVRDLGSAEPGPADPSPDSGRDVADRPAAARPATERLADLRARPTEETR